jgi:hypothetical protein
MDRGLDRRYKRCGQSAGARRIADRAVSPRFVQSRYAPNLKAFPAQTPRGFATGYRELERFPSVMNWTFLGLTGRI